jgi:site-specific DNA-methyltransferase (adenine-specific)
VTAAWGEIRHGDAFELLAALEPCSIDAVVTDPPYGERAASWDAFRDIAWHERWMRLAASAMRPSAPLIAFCSRRYVDVVMGAMRNVFGDTSERPLQTGAWVHRQGHPVAAGMLRPEHEPFIVSGRLRVDADDVRRTRSYKTPHNMSRKPTHRRENARGYKEFTYTPNEAGPVGGTLFEHARNIPAERTSHPTQKPEALMEYLVLLASAPGEQVLDVFTGSGTTGVACRRHGRRFLGFESDAEHVETARQRIAGPLFAEAGA